MESNPKTTNFFENVIAVDVDDTLILHDEPKDPENKTKIQIQYPGGSMVEVWVHEAHLQFVKDQHAKGRTILIWSQGGGKWVEAVAEALGLNKLNPMPIKMSKPFAFVDDLDSVHWMNNRVWIGTEPRLGSNPDKGLQNLDELDDSEIF
jgi:hypothetical protein